MADVVFFLKASPPKGALELPWPEDVKLIALNPPGAGEPTSTSFASLASSLRDSSGRILPNLLAKYAPGVSVGRIAFVGFSAAHGFLDPFARNDADRARTSAYLLLDATFDGFGAKHGKPGYVAFARDAAEGQRLLVTTTANSATWDAAAQKATHLTGNESWSLVWADVIEETGLSERIVSARPPMPEPAGGVHELGSLLYWYEYVDASGKSQVAHTDMGKLMLPMLQAYLVPFWRGELGDQRLLYFAAGAVAVGAALALSRLKR